MATLDPWVVAALLAVGLAAGFMNVVAGGGSLLTMPLLIFLGLPESTANGTARVAIFVQNFSAVLKYRKEGRLDLALAGRMLLPALMGALLGAYLASQISDDGFRNILGWVMLVAALLVAANPRPAMERAGAAADRQLGWQRVWPVLMAIGFYGGMIQAGVGYLILASFTFVLGMPLLEANIMKVLVVFAYTPIALTIFFVEGMVDLLLGIVLAVGQAAGGWIGAAVALERGAGLIRGLLVVAVILSGVKLLGGFELVSQLLD